MRRPAQQQAGSTEHEGDAFDMTDFGRFDWDSMTDSFAMMTELNPDTSGRTALDHFTSIMTDTFGTETVEAAGFLDFGF
jgi:hypothetical protein